MKQVWTDVTFRGQACMYREIGGMVNVVTKPVGKSAEELQRGVWWIPTSECDFLRQARLFE